MKVSLSTEDVPENDKIDYWQYVCRELIGGFETCEYGREEFSGSVSLFDIGTLKIGHFLGSPQTFYRPSNLISNNDTDDYIIVIESEKTLKVDHGQHQRVGSGGLVFMDITQPYRTTHSEGVDVIDILIPRKLLDQALGPARHAAGLAIDASQSSFPAIASFLTSLSQSGMNLDAASATRLSSIAIDLIAAGLAERMEQLAPQRLGSATTLYRAQAFISGHIGRPGLGMSDIAAALKVSVRHLQQAARDEGVSLIDWLWERRLQRAHVMLTTPANNPLGVASVAFRCGFTDQAHFSRRFKERYGQSPSEVRAARSLSSPGPCHVD